MVDFTAPSIQQIEQFLSYVDMAKEKKKVRLKWKYAIVFYRIRYGQLALAGKGVSILSCLVSEQSLSV